MPAYDYQCEECSFTIEQTHGINKNPPKTKCSSCGGKLIKLISAPAFVLKGDGWFSSGYSKSPPVVNENKKPEKKET